MATFDQMESLWSTLINSIGDAAWINVTSSTTGEFYRVPVAAGGLYHWDRAAGAWVSVSNPGNLIAVTLDRRL